MRRYLIVVAAIAVTLAIILIQHKKIVALKYERDKGISNVEILLSDVETYRVRDSLHAATIGSLRLTLDEYERARKKDASTIRALRIKNRDLRAVTESQTKMIFDLSSAPRDTIVIRDSVKVPAVAVHAGDAWFDFDGLLTDDDFSGTLSVRDSLLIAETVKYKRFLGFLWKTKKIKNRKIDIISKNPHVTITGLEHIIIEN